MQGAKKYVEAIITLARKGGYGFEEYKNSNCHYKNGNFLFVCNRHARGTTLDVFLLKEMPKMDATNDEIWKALQNEENSLQVYGAVSGHLGWDETYGYLVNNEIKQVLSSILIDAGRNYNELLNKVNAKNDTKKRNNAVAYANKVKDFEQFLLNGCKETAPEKTSSESGKTVVPRTTNPVEIAYNLLLEVRETGDETLVDDAIGYLGQALDESDDEDENIITLEMIKEGLKQGLIIPKVEGDGLKCYIGEYFFFFGGSEFEGIEELSEIPEDVLPMEIKTVLDAFNETKNHDFETEYMYYYYYLLENLKKESDAE